MNTNVNKPLGAAAPAAADRAAQSADDAISATKRSADSTLEGLSAKVEDIRGQAAPLLNRVSAQAEAAARRGMEAVRDTSKQIREKAVAAGDTTVGYIKDEPVKAMLIAAATGALLMGLVTMVTRSRD